MVHTVRDENPNDSRHFIPYIEFYITNVCNLTCSNCNRFNNHDFKGWQRWSDYADLYYQWSQRVKLQRITILGGEPLLNPSLLDWVDGINSLWNLSVQVLTNGTRLNHFPGLYDGLMKFQSKSKNWIGVSIHNEKDRDRCFEEIKKFLRGSVKYVAKDDPENHNNAYTYGGEHAFLDSNGMRVCVWEYDNFYTAAVQRNQFGTFTLHNSDPQLAHQNCSFAQSKCYHFIRGSLYKCGPVALFPEFDAQHRLDISDQDRQLVNSYRPLNVADFDTNGIQFLNNIDSVIPQCKFCPENYVSQKLWAVSKKSGSQSCYD